MNRLSAFSHSLLHLLALLLLALGFSVPAQAQSNRPLHYRFKLVGQEVGLPERLIFCMTQDSLGYLWVGTTEGLYRHDGKTSQRFFPPTAGNSQFLNTEQQARSLRSSVMSLCPGPRHRLWLGTSEGLFSLNTSTGNLRRITLRSADGTTLRSEVRALLLDSRQRLWIATYRQGLFRLSPQGDTLDHFTSDLKESAPNDQPLPSSAVLSLLQDNMGQIWIGTRSGLVRWNEDTGDFTRIPEARPSTTAGEQEVVSLAQSPDGQLWMATWAGGLKTLTSNSKGEQVVRKVPMAASITNTRVVVANQDLSLLVGTQNGLYRLDPKDAAPKRLGGPGNQHALEDQNVRCLFIDSSQGLWVGTYSGGLHYLISHVGVDFYTRSSLYYSMTGNIVRGFVSQGPDRLWVPTEDGGLNCFNPQREYFERPLPKLALRHDNTRTVFIDGDRAFVGYRDMGADCFDLRTGEVTPLPEVPIDAPARFVNTFYKDRWGKLYAGTDQGLCLWDSLAAGFRALDLVKGPVSQICEDIEGNLWLTTQGQGALCLPKGNRPAKHYSVAGGNCAADSLLTCLSDAAGNLWFGSVGAGLLRYDPITDQVVACTGSLSNLASETVYALVSDLQGRLWFSTSTGIRCLNPRIMSLAYHFTPEKGLPIHRFCPRAAYRDARGCLFFGGMNGFCILDLPHLREERPVLAVHIQDFKPLFADSLLHGRCRRALRQESPILLPRGQDNFEISYIAPEFDMPGSVTYIYKLSPLDTLWQRAENRSSVQFTNVPPGKYEFRVRAFLHSGSSAESHPLYIEVRPPIWASTFMRLVYLALLLAGLGLCVYKRAVWFPQWFKPAPSRRNRPAVPIPGEDLSPALTGELHPNNKLMLGVKTEQEIFMEKLEQELETRLSDPRLSVGQLSEALNISQSKFQRKIKELYDTTPIDYIRTRRLERSKELMDKGMSKVKDISYAVGFSSSSYFAKCFSTKYGITPAEYMNKSSAPEA